MEFAKFTVVPPTEIETIDIEAKIEDLFMAAFRAQFAHDPRFTFLEDPTKSKLTITLEYPANAEAPQAKPHILISNIAYSMNLDTSMYRNYYYDTFNVDKYNDKAVYANIIPYSLTLTAIGESKSESKDLANQLINYMSLVYRKMYDQIGLNIMSVNKSSTMGSARYPEKIFETPIQILGRLEWTGIIATIDKSKEYVLDSVNIGVNIDSDA